MKISRYCLVVITLLCSCRNNDIVNTSIIKMQERARIQFENEIAYFLTSMGHKKQENEEKYGELFDMMNQFNWEYFNLLDEKENCIKNYQQFLLKLTNNLRENYYDVSISDSLWTFEISETPSNLEYSSLKLALSACYHDFCLINYFNLPGSCYRFYRIQPYPITTTEDEYHFSLVANHLEEFELKSFQVDSIKKNNDLVFLPTRIQPSSIAAVSLEHSGIGEYEVFGHVDIFEPRYNMRPVFSHKFTISE